MKNYIINNNNNSDIFPLSNVTFRSLIETQKREGNRRKTNIHITGHSTVVIAK